MRFAIKITAAVFILFSSTDHGRAQTPGVGPDETPFQPQGKLYVPLTSLPPSNRIPNNRPDENLLTRFRTGSALIASAPFANDALSKHVVVDPNEFQFTGLQARAMAFTNIEVFKPDDPRAIPQVISLNQTNNPVFIETPASIACLYALNGHPKIGSCAPTAVNHLPPPTGGQPSTTIAIVVPFDAPHARNDLAKFADTFGLPPANFDVVFASGNIPPYNKQWELEASLDMEWTFAMAPSASIRLIEAASDNAQDLKIAVEAAAVYVSNHGGGEVVMSWILSNLSSTDVADFETIFSKPRGPGGVVFFAASGDTPGVNYPSTSANVVAVGGTSINRNQNGIFLGESPWSLGGAGVNASIPRPAFQDPVSDKVKGQRGVVDVSAASDAKMGGVFFYDSNNDLANEGWAGGGGTSAATAIIAGIVNNAGRFVANSQNELAVIYKSVMANGSINAKTFTDINTIIHGNLASRGCGINGTQYLANVGWDYCTGVGTPNGLGGL